jgi:cell division protein FtsQ
MSGVSIQVDERWLPPGPPKAAPRPKQRAAKTLARRWRWPGALRSALIRRTAAALAALILLLAAIVLFPGKKIVNEILAWSGRAGFRVEDIFVEGRVKTPRDQLLTALKVARGDSIFAIDLTAARHRVEEIPWVRTAVVERRLPNQIHLLITERAPIALWQNKGRYFLVDRDGQIVGDQIEDYSDLPLTVGEGAPDHAAQLLALLQSEPSLRGRVKSASWIGDRRWNLTLDRSPDGIEVRLPEETAEAAWHDLARLEAEQHLLERQISVVDLRLPDRLVLRAAGSPAEPKHKIANGKDA